MKDLGRALKKAITAAGRFIEYRITGESDYHVSTAEYRDFDTVTDLFKARLLQDDVRRFLHGVGVEVREPVLVDLFDVERPPPHTTRCDAPGLVGLYKRQSLKECTAHVVLVQKGLPRGRYKAVLGHELVHAFQRERGLHLNDKTMREGLARWVEYKILLREGAPKEAHRLLKLRFWAHGRGIHLLLELEKQHGEKGVVPYLLNHP